MGTEEEHKHFLFDFKHCNALVQITSGSAELTTSTRLPEIARQPKSDRGIRVLKQYEVGVAERVQASPLQPHHIRSRSQVNAAGLGIRSCTNGSATLEHYVTCLRPLT